MPEPVTATHATGSGRPGAASTAASPRGSGAQHPHPGARRALWILAAVAVFVGLAFVLWRWTPLGDYVEPQALRDTLGGLRSSGWAVPAIWGLFVVSGLLVVPINLVFLAVGLAFGFGKAVALSLSGGILSALVLTEIGRHLQMEPLFERAPETLRRIRDRNLRDAGVLELAMLRLLPLGPFTTMNLLWGAARVPRRRVVFASLIGLLPGVVATALIGDGLTMQDLSGRNLLVAGLGCALLLGLAIAGRRHLARPSDRTGNASAAVE